MFTELKTSHRLHAGFILAIAFLLVLSSNRLYHRHFSTLQNSVNSVYDDRIKVQDYIYQLNNIFHSKRLRLIHQKDYMTVSNENKRAEKLLSQFSLTELTNEEYDALNELTLQFGKLKTSEEKILQFKNLDNGNTKISLQALKEIDKKLDILAAIQLEESKQMTQLSNKALESNLLISKLSLGFLIVIGLALLALIFYPLNTKRHALD